MFTTYVYTDYADAYEKAVAASDECWEARGTDEAPACAEAALAAVRAALALPPTFLSQAACKELYRLAHECQLNLRGALDEAVMSATPECVVDLLHAVHEIRDVAMKFAAPVPVRVSRGRLVLA